MHLTSLLAASASLIALSYAADPLAFTAWPKDLQAGKPVTLTWAGAVPDQPVTLTLRKGNAGNLDDVETITDQAKDGTFTWTPGDNVKAGESYAFQVTQGGQSNYSGLLKAAGNPAAASDSTKTGTAATAATAGTTATNSQTNSQSQTQSTGTTSKPLISSSAGITPSSTPASTTVTHSVTAEVPFATESDLADKKASSSGGNQDGAASLCSYSRGLLLGAVGLLVYLIQ
ncbi:hypothetical protein N7462_000640 [Penicillium macrosclerotiorum]|uniref:uncharacterized protein n=1 Tax=Penicillium macrosclerotiorum TaxID=303699 RepID=UPI0025471352|nr:uncharacterized protein N7462_000640 [Penicillium macrosclerotiorum]KAJ5698635.1 hypothetical protein N7462_000640 [Penicillium macrosclerotiorum]